jgi:hypothetical protein
MLKEILLQLGKESDTPCVTISMIGHRTHPDNLQDSILLKNLLKEATDRVLADYNKRNIAGLLENLKTVETDINHDYNEAGMYIFVSENLRKVIKTKWPPAENKVYVDDHFALKDIIKAYNRSAHYYILHLSQSGVQLFEAEDDRIVDEVRSGDFPFKENPFYLTDQLKSSDPKSVDKMVQEFFNRVDKAFNSIHKLEPMSCIVAGTTENFSLLNSVADSRNLYSDRVSVNPHVANSQQLAEAAWVVMQQIQQKHRSEAIEELVAAIPAGKVYTDIREIYKAAREGRADLLMIDPDYRQAILQEHDGFELVSDNGAPPLVDDVVNEIAWQVFLHKGRVFFTAQPALKNIGEIVLKTRY